MAAFNQPLGGLIEPVARTWDAATPGQRRRFYERAAQLAVREKRAELSRAIGANGRRMKPRKHPRPDGADGPVMTPHGWRSRTTRLLAARIGARGITLFWHSAVSRAQKTPWGTILGFHAEGKVRGAPIRDVRLSKRGINRVRDELAAFWSEIVRASKKAR